VLIIGVTPMKRERPEQRRRSARGKKKLTFGEQRLLSYLNHPQLPTDMATDVAFAGVRLTVENASAIIRARQKLGRFTEIAQVLRIEGLDVEGFQALIEGLEIPEFKVDIPEAAVEQLEAHWKSLPDEERRFLTTVHPGITPSTIVEAYYTTVAATTVALEPPAELVWREFWKRVAAWLAKRGLAAAALAAADGPLPIGDLIAIGLTIWTIWELIELWDVFWQDAVLAASIGELAKKAWEMVPTLEHHIEQKLPNQTPCSDLWHYYIREIKDKLKDMLRKIGRIPPGKKHAEAANRLRELVERFRDRVRQAGGDEALDALDDLLRAAGLL
jgi:hypothetical protein